MSMDVVHAFSKGVKDIRVEHQVISDFGNIGKIADIIGILEELHGAQRALFEDIGLDSNVKEWVIRLIEQYQNNVDRDIMTYLLRDFTDKMKTRMREETKYVIGLLTTDRLLLCHSIYGGETITPTWDIIPRMLDRDNVLRYVSFIKNEGIISLIFWEKDFSQSFIDWLGLKRRKVFQFGGKYRIISEIAGMTIELQLDEKQIEDLINTHSEFMENQISLSSPIHELSIEEIRVGTKHYEDSKHFLQIYQAEKYGILPYAEKYEELMKSISPVVIKYIDDETQVVSLVREQQNIEVKKDLPDIEILYVNQYIDLAIGYCKKLVTRLINNESMRIFHAGCEFNLFPFVLKNMEVLNNIQIDDLTRLMTEFYNSISLQDKALDKIIKYAILVRIAKINGHLPITHLFSNLALGIVDSMEIKEAKWTKGEDTVLEYKSSDYIIGSDADIIDKLAKDITNKLQLSPFKIYLIGIEDDGNLNPANISRLPSDRIEKIYSGLLKKLTNVSIYPCRIIYSDKCILLMAVVSNPH